MELNGFDRGLEAEKVLTIVQQAEKTFMSVKFKGQPTPELIPVEVANEKISGMVIDFYEAHLSYDSSGQEDEVESIGEEQNNSVKRKAEPNEEPRKKIKQLSNDSENKEDQS